MESTKESQYEHCVRVRDEFGLTPLGLMANQACHDNPRHLVFLLSRYKFVSKMLSCEKNVAEIPCATPLRKTRCSCCKWVENVTAVDFYTVFNRRRQKPQENRPLNGSVNGLVHDMLSGPIPPGDYWTQPIPWMSSSTSSRNRKPSLWPTSRRP